MGHVNHEQDPETFCDAPDPFKIASAEPALDFIDISPIP
jgi:hypothetical protein